MQSSRDVAAIRLDNALVLFDEFVRNTAKTADAAQLRGLEGRFAERLQIQPSYWSQIKGRSRQIGERLARQFELNCGKPAGWMDQPHGSPTPAVATEPLDDKQPRDDDERFIVGLVLSYYRRHPQRARTRLLDLLGEVLVPTGAPEPAPPPVVTAAEPAVPAGPAPRPGSRVDPRTPIRPGARPGTTSPTAVVTPPADDAQSLWRQAQRAATPLKPKR